MHLRYIDNAIGKVDCTQKLKRKQKRGYWLRQLFYLDILDKVHQSTTWEDQYTCTRIFIRNSMHYLTYATTATLL